MPRFVASKVSGQWRIRRGALLSYIFGTNTVAAASSSTNRDRLKAQARNYTDHDLLARLEFPGRYSPDLTLVTALEEIWRRLTGEEGVTIGFVGNRPFAVTEEALRRRAERVSPRNSSPATRCTPRRTTATAACTEQGLRRGRRRRHRPRMHRIGLGVGAGCLRVRRERAEAGVQGRPVGTAHRTCRRGCDPGRRVTAADLETLEAVGPECPACFGRRRRRRSLYVAASSSPPPPPPSSSRSFLLLFYSHSSPPSPDGARLHSWQVSI